MSGQLPALLEVPPPLCSAFLVPAQPLSQSSAKLSIQHLWPPSPSRPAHELHTFSCPTVCWEGASWASESFSDSGSNQSVQLSSRAQISKHTCLINQVMEG